MKFTSAMALGLWSRAYSVDFMLILLWLRKKKKKDEYLQKEIVATPRLELNQTFSFMYIQQGGRNMNNLSLTANDSSEVEQMCCGL